MASTSPYGLQDKQWRFVQEYLKDFDAARAYRAAHYHVTTDRAAWSASCRLLKNVKVRAALRRESTKLLAAAEVTPEKVVRELARLGFSDMRNYADWDTEGVHLKPSAALDDGMAAAVAEVSEEQRTFGEVTVRTVKFKLHSKMDGLNGLAKYLDLYGEAKALSELGHGLASLLRPSGGTPDARAESP